MDELPTYLQSAIAGHGTILTSPTSIASDTAPSYDNSALTFLVHPFSYGCERITTINNQQRLYFLESPTNVPPYNTGWHFVLSLRNIVPPGSSPSLSSTNRSSVLKITKSNYIQDSLINLEACNSTWKRKLRRINIKDIGEVYECIGLEGARYYWMRTLGTNDYKCISRDDEKIVGHLVRKTLRSTQSIRGEINIHTDYGSDSELLLACALSLEALGRMVKSGCKIM